ncbi:MAG: hypothetical protein NTY35_06550 [Planctomycetota bacterium]|nr:hypothetical protein [Planctomycetota bacterium]
MKLQGLLLVVSASALAAPASATDLYVGSPNTAFAHSSPPGGPFQLLSACGGPVAALAGEGGELYVASTFESVYRYRHDAQFTELWAILPGETLTGIAIRGHELLVATASSRVVALDRSLGTVLREWNTPIAPTTLAVDRGELFAGTPFGAAMRLEGDGTVSFLGSCGSNIAGIAASATELFLGSAGAFVWRVDRSTGFVTTSFAVAEDPTGIVYDQGLLYVSSATGRVRTYAASNGALLATQNWGNPISALALGRASAGTAYCFGDAAVCPCGFGDPFGGCPSNLGVGARLVTYGSASFAADDLELAALDVPSTTLGRFYMGAGVVQVPFGNGLLCAGSGGYGQFRFPVQSAQANGFNRAFRFGPGIVAHSQQNFGALGAIQPGSTWRFQAWYRDALNPCGGAFNTSNATSVTFLP